MTDENMPEKIWGWPDENNPRAGRWAVMESRESYGKIYVPSDLHNAELEKVLEHLFQARRCIQEMLHGDTSKIQATDNYCNIAIAILGTILGDKK